MVDTQRQVISPRTVVSMRLGIFLILIFAVNARAAVSLPTEGYCRPGRYFPVRASGPTKMDAGAIITNAEDARIVPVLAGENVRQLHANDELVPLRIPGEGQKLIGCAVDPPDEVADVFPGSRLVAIRLDPGDPLPGPPVAWETLDAVVLDFVGAGQLLDEKRSALLAGGMTLVVVGADRPDARWPWKQQGGLWTLSMPLAGPTGRLVDHNVYETAYLWDIRRPGAVRLRLVLLGAIFAAMVVAVTIIFRRAIIPIVLMLAVVVIGITIFWRRSLGTFDRGGGDVIVQRDGLLQQDAWSFFRARSASTIDVPFDGNTRPIFASSAASVDSPITLVSGQGQMRFQIELAARHTVAVMHRSVGVTAAPAVNAGVDSPMREMAKIYLADGLVVSGETAATPPRWAGVLIEHSSR